ncbi:MAG: hypothetical protein AABX65_02915 [Nanoarchaeota archaeon]
MAEQTQTLEREYIVNLRHDVMKVQWNRRASKAAKSLKEFIARHMKIAEHDITKVKLDKWLNVFLWKNGIKNPPLRIKVKATKENNIVRVELAEVPEYLKFKISKEKKLKDASAKQKEENKKEEKPEEKKELTGENKAELEEKREAVKEAAVEHTHLEAREHKHEAKKKEVPIKRMALKK